jgi:hypothetical protein
MLGPLSLLVLDGLSALSAEDLNAMNASVLLNITLNTSPEVEWVGLDS